VRISFHRPVFIGDEVSCYAELLKVGRTSLTVSIQSWVRRGVGADQIAVTEGVFTYVAVDATASRGPRRPRAESTRNNPVCAGVTPADLRASTR